MTDRVDKQTYEDLITAFSCKLTMETNFYWKVATVALILCLQTSFGQKERPSVFNVICGDRQDQTIRKIKDVAKRFELNKTVSNELPYIFTLMLDRNKKVIEVDKEGCYDFQFCDSLIEKVIKKMSFKFIDQNKVKNRNCFVIIIDKKLTKVNYATSSDYYARPARTVD